MPGQISGKITADTEVNGTELAVVLGLSKRRIEQMIQDGTLQTISKGRLSLADSVQRYIKFVSGDPADKDDIKIEKSRRKAEALMKASKASIAKLEADELQGKMHRSEDVAAMTEDLVYTIRGMLLALPGRLAVDVAAADSPAEAAEIIRKEVFSVMQELSRYRYDPEKYEARVRERRDWETIVGQDDYDE